MDVLILDMDAMDDGVLPVVARRLRELQPAMTVIMVGRRAPAGMRLLVSELAEQGDTAVEDVHVLRLGTASTAALSAREAQVLRLVGAGLTNKGIAIRLGITAHTVSRHISNILHKLGAQNRAEAVQLANGRSAG